MATTIRSRSEGISVEGVKDQYADGKAAKVWEHFIGDLKTRTQNYKDFIIGLLRLKGCHRIIDVACGTGVDSMMLVEAGFEVTSVDASDKMLKYALKSRWNRRKDPKFDNWVIEEANWVSLQADIKPLLGEGFDAVFCLGNSFAHLLDTRGDQRDQKRALMNFASCLKPGGLLIIDHRNYDHIIDNQGLAPSKSIYYNSNHHIDIKTSLLIEGGKPKIVMLDYYLDVSDEETNGSEREESQYKNGNSRSEFRLSYYPHKLSIFTNMLKEAFGSNAKHEIFGDFKSINKVENPAFYIHVIEKPTMQ